MKFEIGQTVIITGNSCTSSVKCYECIGHTGKIILIREKWHSDRKFKVDFSNRTGICSFSKDELRVFSGNGEELE